MNTTLVCNKDYGDGECRGKVTMWYRPRDDKGFPYCELHREVSQNMSDYVRRVYGL
jgi:hypothetical protein